jgi:anti-sigma-K factor RskA
MNMNDETDSLERLLRGMTPAAPNPELRERVAADLRLDETWLPRQVRHAPRWVVAAGWAGMGAAAAVAVMGMMMRDFAPAKATPSPVVEVRLPQPEAATLVKRWSTAEGALVEVKTTDGRKPEGKAEPKAVLPVNFQ